MIDSSSNPFADLSIARAVRARSGLPSVQEQVAVRDRRLAGCLDARAARFETNAERIAIDEADGGLKPGEILPAVPGQQEFLDRLLTGSQAKTAFALRMNAERMIKEDGLNSTGFLTLTIGDHGADGNFYQVHDAKEASRRINNLNRRFLGDLFTRAIIVTERHKTGAIHFHILGSLRNKPDIRTGLNFDAVKKRDYRSASPVLKNLWAMLRDKLPGYGFGRSELLPVRKTGEAVASYVSKYIEKNVCNRTPDDKHKKLVRYLGWNKSQLKPNEFGWAGKKAVAWRCKARALAGLVGIQEPEQAAECLGPRWAWKLTNLWRATLGDDLQNGFTWDFRTKEFMRAQLANENIRWARHKEAERYQFSEETREMRGIFPATTQTTRQE